MKQIEAFGDNPAPLLSMIAILYCYSIVTFISQVFLIRANASGSEGYGKKIWFSQFGLCLIAGLFDFWIGPSLKDYYVYSFGVAGHLPESTHFVLYTVPRGALTCLVVIAWILTFRAASGSKLYNFHRNIFFAVGAGVLICLPPILLLPFLSDLVLPDFVTRML